MNHAIQLAILDITFPINGKLRSRKVISRSNSRKTHKYPSLKIDRTVYCDSEHERNAMLLLDANLDVISFCEQPCVITYILNGELHHHYPDILVVTRSGRELWEVTVRKNANQPDVLARSQLMIKHLPSLKYTYRLVLAEDLAMQPRLRNADLLTSYAREDDLSALQREKLRTLFRELQTLPWGMFLFDTLIPKSMCHVARLILDGSLSIDMTKPITENSAVRWVLNSGVEGGA